MPSICNILLNATVTLPMLLLTLSNTNLQIESKVLETIETKKLQYITSFTDQINPIEEYYTKSVLPTLGKEIIKSVVERMDINDGLFIMKYFFDTALHPECNQDKNVTVCHLFYNKAIQNIFGFQFALDLYTNSASMHLNLTVSIPDHFNEEYHAESNCNKTMIRFIEKAKQLLYKDSSSIHYFDSKKTQELVSTRDERKAIYKYYQNKASNDTPSSVKLLRRSKGTTSDLSIDTDTYNQKEAVKSIEDIDLDYEIVKIDNELQEELDTIDKKIEIDSNEINTSLVDRSVAEEEDALAEFVKVVNYEMEQQDLLESKISEF